MSALIGCTLLRRTQATLPAELLAYSLHTSSTLLKSHGGPSQNRPSSRRRLAKSLEPKEPTSKDALLEVAPSQRPNSRKKREAPPPFVRDEVPHPGAQDLFVAREQAQMHRRRQRATRERSEPSRPGTWNSAPKYSSSRRAPTEPAKPEEKPFSTQSRPKVSNPLVSDDFDRSVRSEPVTSLPSEFTSPPLMPGLLDSVVDVLGPHATPTPIQGLALKHLLYPWKTKDEAEGMHWREFLLASETGSGKSLAYMLPMLQDLKASELTSAESDEPREVSKDDERAYNPRAIVLAPTHELSRQLSSTAKALLHNIKMRVLCASRANVPSTVKQNVTASKMSAMFDDSEMDGVLGIHKPKSRPIDVLVGTTSKILEMGRGHGWNWDVRKQNVEDSWDVDEKGRKIQRKKFIVGQPEVGLHRVEWVVVDEADVLFDPDFQDQTRLLLSDIARARNQYLAKDAETSPESTPEAVVKQYPFNLVLTSATIPTALASYLDTHHPRLKRLVSPNLHHLPSTLRTEHAAWTSGNRNADVEARIKRIWWTDVHQGTGRRSRVLVFCNRSTKVEELGRYLAANGVPNVAMTSTAEARKRGSNHHLDGFLHVPASHSPVTVEEEGATSEKVEAEAEDTDAPRVLITTSLLSRGLDFSPEIKNVLIVDAPRNMIDFLHRAGRTARAGAKGTVIVFGKSKGRGATKDKDVKQRIGRLQAR